MYECVVKMYFVYILFCNDGSLYTGYTNNLENRLKKHNSGKGAKYTRSRLPCRMVYHESYQTKSEAMKREYYIKHHMTREDKLELIKKQ